MLNLGAIRVRHRRDQRWPAPAAPARSRQGGLVSCAAFFFRWRPGRYDFGEHPRMNIPGGVMRRVARPAASYSRSNAARALPRGGFIRRQCAGLESRSWRR